MTSPSLVQADQIISDVENILSGAPDISTGLAAVDFYFDDPAGGFVNTVYVGSNLEAPSLEISKNEFLTQPIRADRQEIKDTVKIFAITAAVHNGATSSTSDSKVALEYVGEQGLKINEKLIETERLIGERQEVLERTEMHLNLSELVLEKAYNSATSADVFKEAAFFEEFQVQLETSYKVLVRLSSLKLTNFL